MRSPRLGCKATLVVSLLTAAFFTTDFALAQSTVLEEVIVTARKRTENIQNVPIAITALSGESLRDSGIDELVDVGRMSPNVTMNATSGLTDGALEVFIRGIGNDPGFDQGVGIYLDDVYMNRSSGLLMDVYDVERIEILKGPQGNLYGRNTVGGAIKYISREPGEEASGSLEIKGGEYGLFKVKGGLSGPLGDAVGAGVSFSYKESDGYQKNIFNGDKHGAADALAVRGILTFKPSDSLNVKLIADYNNDESVPLVPNRHALNLDSSGEYPDAFNAILTTASSFFSGVARGTNLQAVAAGGANIFSEEEINALARAGVGTAVYGGDLDKRLPTDIDRVNTAYTDDGYDRYEIEQTGYVATVEWDITDDWSVKSVTSLRTLDNVIPFDFDGSDQLFINNISDREQEDLTQELQFNYSSDNINAVIGLYYLDADREETSYGVQGTGLRLREHLITDTLSDERDAESKSIYATVDWDFAPGWQLSLGGRYTEEEFEVTQSQDLTYTRYPVVMLTQAGADALKTSLEGRGVSSEDATRQAAGFQQLPMLIHTDAVAAMTKLLAVTGAGPSGALYEWGKLSQLQSAATTPAAATASATRDSGIQPTKEADESWDEFTPSVKLSYHLSDDIMLYGGVATGFKAGGIDVNGIDGPRPYDPETVTSYSLGFKSTLAGGTVRLNMEAFYNDYADKQLAYQNWNPVSMRLTRQVDNVAEATMQGAEMELTWQTPVDGLVANLHLGYLDSEIEEYLENQVVNNNIVRNSDGTIRQVDVAGHHELGFAPELTAQLRLSYEMDLGGAGSLLLSADAAYRDDSWTTSPVDTSDSDTGRFESQALSKEHTIWNAVVSYRSADERWWAEVVGRNLGDKRVLVNSFNVSNFMGGGYTPPRQVDVSVGYRF